MCEFFFLFCFSLASFKKVVNFVIQLRYFMACLLEVNWFPVIKSPFLFFSLLHGKKQRLTTMPSLRKDSNIILSSSELRGNCTPLFLRIAQSATKWRPHHWDLSNHHSEGKKRVFNQVKSHYVLSRLFFRTELNFPSFRSSKQDQFPPVFLKKGLKACLHWKVHLTYPASLQALHSYT